MKRTEHISTSELAKRGRINLQTIRYYERLGLLPKPPRSQSGYRQFPEAAPRRVRFIKRAQELGFSLKEIKELLALRVEPGKTRADVRQRAEAKIADIEGKIKSLRKTKVPGGDHEGLLRRWPGKRLPDSGKSKS